MNEHGRLIDAAARRALLPLGCLRRGRSRFWYADHRYWVIAIEFQPSGWSKGSYLNVGACWLWRAIPRFEFNTGYRIADFIPFESAAQFTPLIEAMADRAAEEVRTLRRRFRSLEDVRRELMAIATHGHRFYDAAVAAGIAGDAPAARQLFQRLQEWRGEVGDFSRDATADVLAPLLDRPAELRAAVIELIRQRRLLIKLPPDPDCLVEDSTIVPLRARSRAAETSAP